MKEIIFKLKDNKLHILVDSKLSNKEFLIKFKERVEKLFVIRSEVMNDVILNINDRTLNNREILELFDILNETEVFYLSKVNCKNIAKESIVIYKGNLRGGQARFFDKSLLLVGGVNKGSKIVVNGDLYVLGRLEGDVELKDKHGKIYCESIYNSLVKIGDIYKLYTQELIDKKICIENGEIIEKDYKREEIYNGKSNSCYIG